MCQNLVVSDFYQLSIIINRLCWKHFHLNKKLIFLMNLNELIFSTGDSCLHRYQVS